MKTLNENIIKITGSASISRKLNMDKDYEILLTASCQARTKKTNNDGTYNNHYSLALLTGEIKNDLGETVKMKDKMKNTQKIRQLCYQMNWDYDDFIMKVLINAEDINQRY